MQIEQDVLTPDLSMLSTGQLAQDVVHDYYTEVATYLVIEIAYPEQDAVDRQARQAL